MIRWWDEVVNKLVVSLAPFDALQLRSVTRVYVPGFAEVNCYPIGIVECKPERELPKLMIQEGGGNSR